MVGGWRIFVFDPSTAGMGMVSVKKLGKRKMNLVQRLALVVIAGFAIALVIFVVLMAVAAEAL